MFLTIDRFQKSTLITIISTVISLSTTVFNSASAARLEYETNKSYNVTIDVPPGALNLDLIGSASGTASVKNGKCEDVKRLYGGPQIPINATSGIAICPNITAESNVIINTNLANNTVTGDAKAFGYVDGTKGVGNAKSKGSLGITYKTKSPKGKIQLMFPLIGQSFGGSTSTPGRVNLVDPVLFKAQDLETGDTLIEGQFFSLNSDLEINSNGSIIINNNLLTFTNISDGVFSINLNNPFIDTSGTLLAIFKNNTLVTSEDTGIFDGLLPPVETIGSFDLLIPNIDFNYSLPDFGKEVNFSLGFDAAGEASLAIPEKTSPLALLIFGILGIISMARYK